MKPGVSGTLRQRVGIASIAKSAGRNTGSSSGALGACWRRPKTDHEGKLKRHQHKCAQQHQHEPQLFSIEEARPSASAESHPWTEGYQGGDCTDRLCGRSCEPKKLNLPASTSPSRSHKCYTALIHRTAGHVAPPVYVCQLYGLNEIANI